MSTKDIQIKHTKLFINNEFVDAVSKKTFPAINPATEEKIADVAEGDKGPPHSLRAQGPVKYKSGADDDDRVQTITQADIDVAVAAAKTAFARGSVWRSMDASARGKLLHKLADLIERQAEELAALESLNGGIVHSTISRWVYGSSATIRYYAGYCDKAHGNTIPAVLARISSTFLQGVVKTIVNAGKHSPIQHADSDGLISHPRLQQELDSGEGRKFILSQNLSNNITLQD
ncbi:hypothetical protein NQ318_014764 [Aromia moschata]|uniref:Aldehyde dehydrogenase domain-containing protein n=1 Tax=Aromia moschata TaxID=1265417 RepID=A0AAV8ZDT9_9CUCU|nr:hypothetical protein NQ318_014764 [Aromia moschata]